MIVTPSKVAEDPLPVLAIGSAQVWAALFAIAHLYWALGGRLGVTPGTADISERPWFLAYDVFAGFLCLVAVALLAAMTRERRRRDVVSTHVLLALRLGTVALALRAVVGLVGDVFLLADSGLRATMLYDLWFLLGAVLFALALRGSAPAPLNRATSTDLHS